MWSLSFGFWNTSHSPADWAACGWAGRAVRGPAGRAGEEGWRASWLRTPAGWSAGAPLALAAGGLASRASLWGTQAAAPADWTLGRAGWRARDWAWAQGDHCWGSWEEVAVGEDFVAPGRDGSGTLAHLKLRGVVILITSSYTEHCRHQLYVLSYYGQKFTSADWGWVSEKNSVFCLCVSRIASLVIFYRWCPPSWEIFTFQMPLMSNFSVWNDRQGYGISTWHLNPRLGAEQGLKRNLGQAHSPTRLCSCPPHPPLPPRKKGSRSWGGGGALHWSWRGSRGGWLKLLGTGPGVCCGNSGGP